MDRVDYQPLIIQDIINLNSRNELDLRPWYQRRVVWTPQQQAYLVNTILEQKPVPSIYVRHHGSRLNEIRIVRNHIAHGNAGTKAEFARVVQRRLGAMPYRLPRAGLFVLREFTPGVPLLVEFVVTLGAILKDAAKV